MSNQFRKKPVVIEAVQYTDHVARMGWGETVPAWLEEAYEDDVVMNVCDGREEDGHGWKNPRLKIKTLEGEHTASPGDWIIQGVKGELYPCKPDIFAATYEAVTT